jgi:serine/threonine protein kinase
LYEVIVTELSVYLVLEYCPGDELYNYLCRKGALPVETVQKIFTQLVGAVAYLHSKNCVHRDLKLENVLLDKNDNVKLCDFGFTREYEGKASYLQTFCGTVCYSAPEMLKGEKYAAEKVDVWSLGIILFALLAGELPFDDDSDVVTKGKILNDDPVFPDTFPEAAVNLIKKLLCKRPFPRPALSDVLADPFLADHAPAQQAILKLTQPAPFSTELEKSVLERMKSAGVDIDKVIESVLSQRCDALGGWWTLLYEKEHRKDVKRDRKRKERDAELKLLRRLSGASGRFSTLAAPLPEVQEESRPGSGSAPHHDRTRSNSRGRRNRRSTPQILVSDLPQLPEGSPINSPILNPPKPIDKDSVRSRSNSRGVRPPLPPKGTSREWKRRSSNLQLVVSNSDLVGPGNGVAKRQTRAGKARRNNQFLNSMHALKSWFIESTERAKSPIGSQDSQKSPSSSKFGLGKEKSKSQPQLSLHVPLSPGQRPEIDRSHTGQSTLLTRNSSYGNTLTPVASNGPQPYHHQKTGSNGSAGYRGRASISPSPVTPRGSRRFSSNAGLRGRKSTSSSVSSVRSMPRHTNHSKASSQSSESGTIHSPGGSRASSMGLHGGRSPHSSLKVLPAGPTFSSSGRLIRSSVNEDSFAANAHAPISKFNEAMIGSHTGGVMFAKRKKSAFKGPHLTAGLFTQPSGPSPGSPALFGRNREGSDHSTSRLFGRNKKAATSGAPAGMHGGSLAIPEEPNTPGKRKSVIVEEDEDEEEDATAPAHSHRRSMLAEEDEDADDDDLPVEEVDAFDDPVLYRGERLDSITYIDGPPPLLRVSKADEHSRPILDRLPSQVLFSPGDSPASGTPMTETTPKMSLEGGLAASYRSGGPESPGEKGSIMLGESAQTPRIDGGTWSR